MDTPYIVSAARAGAFMARALCNAPALRDADALQRREVNSYITGENGRRYDAVTVICFPLDNF
jgi:hypothetical protein